MLAAKEANEQNCAEVVIPHPTCCVTSNWLKVGDYVEFALCVLNSIDVFCTDWEPRVVLIFFHVFFAKQLQQGRKLVRRAISLLALS